MYKALVIGCGNIGAMYDFETESVLTYAKAFHLDPEITFSVYDVDTAKSTRVAKHYGIKLLHELNPEMYRDFDIVAICTPTNTHFDYLSRMLVDGPKLVICEKPVDSDLVRLENIVTLYSNSKTKVLVNFFRRFQPGIVQLKKEISDILQDQRCTNIIVSYQRGFHNNASHAIDLLEFLFESTFDLSTAQITHKSIDEFDMDPTMSVFSTWNGANVQFTGLAHVEFSHFDIAIYFIDKAVMLKDGCNEIEWLSTIGRSGNFYPKLKVDSRRTGVVKNYMENIVLQSKRLLNDQEQNSNFLASVNISKSILQLKGN